MTVARPGLRSKPIMSKTQSRAEQLQGALHHWYFYEFGITDLVIT
jgi:hypothetical protein